MADPERSSSYWLRAAQAGLQLHGAEPAAHRYDRHAHDDYSVILVTEGAKILRVGKQRHEVRSGQIVVINPGESHECEPLRGAEWAHRCWYLRPDAAAAVTGEPSEGLRSFRSPVIDDPALALALRTAHAAGPDTTDGTGDLRQLWTLSALFDRTEAAKAKTTGKASRARAELYRHLLTKSLDERLDLDALAQAAGVTRFQVIRDVNRSYGMSPAVFLRNLRLREAQRLIREHTPLVEVSAETGFADQSHFCRSFKGAFGVTPTAYRAAFH